VWVRNGRNSVLQLCEKLLQRGGRRLNENNQIKETEMGGACNTHVCTKTRQAVYVLRNTEARSRYHCCHGKENEVLHILSVCLYP